MPLQAADLDSLIAYFRAGIARKPPDILWREWSVDDDRPQVRRATQWRSLSGYLPQCLTIRNCIWLQHGAAMTCSVRAAGWTVISGGHPLGMNRHLTSAACLRIEHRPAANMSHGHHTCTKVLLQSLAVPCAMQANRRRPLVVYRHNLLAHIGAVSSFKVRMARPAWPGCYTPLSRVRVQGSGPAMQCMFCGALLRS